MHRQTIFQCYQCSRCLPWIECVVYVHITALNVVAVHDYCMYKIFIACLSYVPCFMWQLTYKCVSQLMLACTNRYLILHGL